MIGREWLQHMLQQQGAGPSRFWFPHVLPFQEEFMHSPFRIVLGGGHSQHDSHREVIGWLRGSAGLDHSVYY